MAVNINVTEDENSIDINDVSTFTVHVKDLSVPGSIQVSQEASDISEDTVNSTTEIRTIDLPADSPVAVSINEVDTTTVTVNTSETNVIEVSDNVSIVTAATRAATRKLRGVTAVDSIWDQSGLDAHYTDGNVGIGTSSPSHPLDVNGNVNATSFTGTFVGALSSSAQIAGDISGALGNLSTTVTTNQNDISANQLNISANQTNISDNQSNINDALSRLDDIQIFTGSLSQSVFVNSSNITSNLGHISELIQDSSSLQSRISSVEAGSTSKTLVSGSSQIATEISGAFTFASSSISLRLSSVEVGSTSKTLVSGSIQIATEISGAFKEVSESIQSRLSSVEVGSTSKTLISGSAQIATEISGAFTPTSESLQSRVSVVEIASASFSTRVATLEDTSADKTFNHVTASGNISASGNIHASGSIKVKINDGTSITLGSYANQGIFPNITTENGKSLFIQGEGGGRLVQIGSDVLPTADLSKDLGSTGRRWNKLHVNEISASTLQTNNDADIGGDLTVAGAVFGLQGFAVTIDDISITTGSTQFGSGSDDTHGFTGSMDITGSLHVTGPISASSLSGVFIGALSASAQIASEVSGAFNVTSESISTRLSVIESELDNTLISSSIQISTEISGAFNVVSESISSRLLVIETELTASLISGSVQIASEISGAFASISSSFNTRLTVVESELDNTLISGSSQIATEISGAFNNISSSLEHRITLAESELTNTLISSSVQIASEISGAFNNIDVDPGLDTGVVVYDSNTKRLYYTGSYTSTAPAITTDNATIQYALSPTSTAVNLSKLVINDYSDSVTVNTDGGVLQLTFGSPSDPFISSFISPEFNSDRFNKEINNYTLDIDYQLFGRPFTKGELSASTAGAPAIGVTTFNNGQNVDIDSNFPFYQSGSHTFTAKVYTSDVAGNTLIIQSVLDLQLIKTNPDNPSISFTNYNITKNAYNEGDMEIEEGAIGNISFNLTEGNGHGWTAAAVHNSTFDTNLTVNTAGNVTTGEIEEYWNSSNDNDPQKYYTGSAERVFTRVRSLRYKVDSVGTTPTEAELLDLNDWSGIIRAGSNTKSEIESITMEFNPSGQFIFIIYDAALGNLSEIINQEYVQNEINAFHAPQIIGNFKYYRTKLPKTNQFVYRVKFPNT